MPKGKVALVRVAYEEVPKPKPVVVRVAYEASKNLEQRVIAAVPVAVKFRKQPTRALEATAYHEAGHAVAAVEFNLGLRMATIEPEEDSLGHDHIGHPPAYCNWDKEAFNEYRARRYAEAGIQMDFAGHIAECRFLGKRALRYTWSGDLNNVIQTWMSMLRRSSHESQVAWVNWLFVEARDFVDMRWYAIEAVAKALLKHKKLSGSQVIAAIRGASAEAVAAAVERQAQVDRQAR